MKSNNKEVMTICIIGLGLIGGSLARALRLNGFGGSIIGVDIDHTHRTIAMIRGLADEFPTLEEAVPQSDLIFLCAPVDVNCRLLPDILELSTGNGGIVADMGSTKADITAVADAHAARGRFVAVHPMAGTEESGPAAAIDNLYRDKVAIICDQERSDSHALGQVTALLLSLGMKIEYMDARSHDMHIAYVSHISHITSFALALCVLEKEKNSHNITALAAGGFESTVRLSKSNPDTWAPIFIENAGPILEAVGTYLEKMELFRQYIKAGDSEAVRQLMITANSIKNILK